MSLQFIKKEVKDEVDFLYADKHQSLEKSTPPPLWRGVASIRPLLCETWFTAVSFSNNVMWNLGIKILSIILE